MGRVTVSNNTIRIPNPVFFQAATLLATGTLAGWVALAQWPRIESSLPVLQAALDGGTAFADPQTLRGDLVPRLFALAIFGVALLLSAGSLLRGLYHGLGWMVRLGGNHYVRAPGDLDRGLQRCVELLEHRSLTREHASDQDEPPLIVKLLLGDFALWLSPSSRELLFTFGRTFRRLCLLSLVLLVPVVLPAGWLTGRFPHQQQNAPLMGVLQGIESNLNWPLPWNFVLLVAGTVVGLILAVYMVRGKQVQVSVVEETALLREKGDPDNFFQFLLKKAKDLEYQSFPNRALGSPRAPGVGSTRIGQRGDFKSHVMFETQPVPMYSGRNIPALFLALLGGALSVAGLWVFLNDPRLSQPVSFGGWFPGLVTGWVGLSGGRQIQRLAWTLAHTFRFHSDLFRFDLVGTYLVARFGVNTGDIGGIAAEVPDVQSNCQLTLHAVRLITEVSAPPNSRFPVAQAMQMPREIVDTSAAAGFQQRLADLVSEINKYEPAPHLPKVEFERGGMQKMLGVNLQLAQSQKSAALPAPQVVPLTLEFDDDKVGKA